MIKRFVLNYIRNHMSHETMNTRCEIFQAINEGCKTSFYEDNLQTRLSWTVGELVRNDTEFRARCSGNEGAELRRYVSLASAEEIAVFRG